MSVTVKSTKYIIFLGDQFLYFFICLQSLEPACLCEETAVNKYNMAALLAEKSAAVGIPTEEAREVERLFEDVVRIWAQQQENGSLDILTHCLFIRRVVDPFSGLLSDDN